VQAVDAAPALRLLVRRLHGGRTGVELKLGADAVALLCPGGADPCPGEAKTLRVR
jgi:hypothetical protein